MATVDNVSVSSAVGVDGNSFTTSIANDQLTNEDFLKLMIQELKLQDPTKPMDSQQMLATQMQMSTIDTNQQMLAAMNNLSNAYTQSSLASASNIIGKNIEDGNISDSGVNEPYTVRSVENYDGVTQVVAQEILYMEDKIMMTNEDGSTSYVDYDVDGSIIGPDGELTGYKVALQNVGEPLINNGELVILDETNDQVSDHPYVLSGVTGPVYSDVLTTLPFESIQKIF